MTQATKFHEISLEYEARGGGPCSYPKIDRERYLAMDTGDVGCLECGMTWPRGQNPPEWMPSNAPQQVRRHPREG